MKILNRKQIRDWDAFTIENEPIASIDLMERASLVFCNWLEHKIQYHRERKIKIVCGPGNNGGDGLAVARLLNQRSYNVTVVICHISKSKSEDFNINYERLPLKNELIKIEINADDQLEFLDPGDIVVDALFGSGLTRPIVGYWASLVSYINQNAELIFSVDIPSGLYCDQVSDVSVIMADEVLSFEIPKLSFFFVEHQDYIRNWTAKPIGLLQSRLNSFESHYFYNDESFVKPILKKRKRFQHKGNFGHSLIIGGSIGMLGAAVLATKACIRIGSGLTSALIPQCGIDIMQVSVNEAMVLKNSGKESLEPYDIGQQYNAIGIGPGLSKTSSAESTVLQILKECKSPLVIDADALNIIAEKKLLPLIPKNSVITPHPKEFERLFGPSGNSQMRIEKQIEKSKELSIYVVLKGAYTAISFPDGRCFFNGSGNPGMATGGSGDVLTGIITGLISQRYTIGEACILGVFLHGLAGDLAAEIKGEASLIANDVIDFIPGAYKKIESWV